MRSKRLPGIGLAILLTSLLPNMACDSDPTRPVPRESGEVARSIGPLPRTALPDQEQDGAAQSVTNSVGMRLLLIPPGEFMMGGDDTINEPQHRVRITKLFYLGATEVTQGQYRTVTGQSPSEFKGSDDLPVERVTWNDAVVFCNKLSEKEGLEPYYQVAGKQVTIVGGSGYRLPTEAEWEYACRGETATRYNFGEHVGSLEFYAWYAKNSGGVTHRVGRKMQNDFGLFDMHGNVDEWCWDEYKSDDAAFFRATGVHLSPRDSEAEMRVVRGGSWNDGPSSAESAKRGCCAPAERLINVGFRVVRDHVVMKPRG